MRRGCGFELADADAGRLFDAGAMLADCRLEFVEPRPRGRVECLAMRAQPLVELLERAGAPRFLETGAVGAERLVELSKMVRRGGFESFVMLGELVVEFGGAQTGECIQILAMAGKDGFERSRRLRLDSSNALW